ncbi:diguanylate cyclase [Fusibacter sp. A1]|nr:diguanylate cyclase [Fusibacter sp. A1]
MIGAISGSISLESFKKVRYGGDEFLILLPDTNENQARSATYTKGSGHSVDSLINAADQAMYHVKKEHKMK